MLYSDHAEITERPAVEKDYEMLTGKMSSFSFLILAHEQIARRQRSCWCAEACMRAHERDSAPMQLSADGKLLCRSCESGQHFGGAAYYPWHEQNMESRSSAQAAWQIAASRRNHGARFCRNTDSEATHNKRFWPKS